MQESTLDHRHANPHALATIMKASEEGQIVAHQDILDEHGAKLWAKDQPVSRELQQRLLERKLREPLESCLRAADGVTHHDLLTIAQRLLADHPALHSGVAPWADELLSDIAQLPLHPVAQLLLTAGRSHSPQAHEHAVMAMMLGGALASQAGGDRYQVRLHMLGGLLHDLGELYIQPDYLHDDRPVCPESWRHICVHPRVGEMLLQRQTDYPRELCRAIGEHHERGNGLGYPMRARQISWLGKRLAAIETFMGVLSTGRAEVWDHAALAVRLLPSEFDDTAMAFASQAARRHAGEALAVPAVSADEVWARAQAHKQGIQAALRASWKLASSSAPRLAAAAVLIMPILEELMRACDALGLWAPRRLLDDALHELHLANQELDFRIQTLPRVVCWLDERWSADEREALDGVWCALQGRTKQLEPA